jgi:hypothetical protein
MDLPGSVVAISLLVVFVLLPGAVAVWAVIVPALRARRMRAAEQTPLPPDRCLACGHTDLEQLAPDVTRCRTCGFTGGEGMSAWQRRRRVHALEKLDPDQRRGLAVRKLREAQLLLGTAHESLDQAASASVIDMAGLSFDRGEEKQNEFGVAVRMIRTALSLASAAAVAVQLTVEIDPPNVLEESSLILALDTAWLTDGLAVDIAVHTRIRKTKVQLREMRERIDTLLLQLTAAAARDLNST